MKKINLIKRLRTDSHEKQTPQRFARYAAMLIMLLTLGAGQMWAGIYECHVTLNGTDKNVNDLKDDNWGNQTDLTLTQFWVKANKYGNDLWGESHMLYKVTTGPTTTGDTDMNSNCSCNNWFNNGYDHYAQWDGNVYLSRNRKPGTYKFEFWFKSKTGSSTWCWYSNNSNNYKVTYTIPDATVSITGASSLVAGTAATISASISDYPAGATLTKLEVSGNVASSVNKTGTGTSISSLSFTPNASGSNGITVTATVTYGSAGTKTYATKYNVSPPAVSGFSVSPSGAGYVTGSGTSESPYMMKHNEGNLVLTMSGSQATSDANSAAQYYNGSSWSATATKTIAYASGSTTKQNVTLKMRYKNNSTTLYGAESSKTVHYQRESAYNVKAVASPAAGGTVTPTANTASGQYSGCAITASNNTGYTFGGWSGGTGTFVDASSASTTFKPTAASTVTATFNETMSTVSFVASPSGKGTFQVGGATVTSTTAGVTTTREVTAVPISGYRFVGWSISGGATISSTTDNPTTVTGGGAGTAATLTATFEEDITFYTLTFGKRSGESSYGSVAAKNSSTDAALTSGTDYLSGTGVTVTATPADDYKFVSWYNAASSGSEISTSNPYSFTLDAAKSVYAHFVRKTTSITLNKGIGSGGTAGPVTATHGSNTLAPSISVNPAKSGYTFTGYWTDPSGGVKVIGTDGALITNVSGYTKSSNNNWDYDETSLTLYAQYTENLTTVTINVSPASTGTLTVGGAAFTPGNTTTAGVTTSRMVVATAANDYAFSSWSVTGNATGTNSTNTYTLKGNGSAGTGTLTANFTQVPCTLWYYTSSATFATKTGQIIMSYDTEEHAYYADVASTPSSPYYFRFYHNGATQYSAAWDGSYPNVKTASANGSKITCDQTVNSWDNKSSIKYIGEQGSKIRIWFDYQNHKTWITASLDNQYVLRGSQNGGGDPNSGMPGWSATDTYFNGLASGNTGTITATLNAATAYKFKVYDMFNAAYKGKNGSGTQAITDGTYYALGTGGDFTFTSTIAGTYTFTMDKSSGLKVKVDFPVSYQLTYAIGTVKGGNGSISSSPSTSSGSYVPSGNSVTLTAPNEKTGYTWKGWYGAAGGTGDQLCATKAYAITMNAAKTVYACYTENEYNATVSAGANGDVSPSGTVSIKQVSGTSITATPNEGYSFSSWSVSGGGITPTSSTTSPQTFKATSADGTITANFSENTYTVNVNRNNPAYGAVSTTSVSGVGISTTSGDITATPETGATFTGWTLPSGVTAAAGYNSSSNPIRINATASGKAITANFSEPTYTATITTENSSKGTVSPSTVTTGQITAVQITATKRTGYMFAGWEKIAGSGEVTYHVEAGTNKSISETGSTDAIAFITIDGDVTLRANWETDRSSGWALRGTWSGGWTDGGDKDFIKNEGEETGTVSHVRWALAPEMFTNATMEMKMYDIANTTYYGHWSVADASENLCTKDANNENIEFFADPNNKDFRVSIPVAGVYDFEWDSSTKLLTVHYPAGNFIRGGFNSWSWDHPLEPTGNDNEYSCVISMTGDNAPHSFTGDDGFKVVLGGDHYGKDATTVTRAANSASSLVKGGGANINLTTDVRGDYTFTVNSSSKTVTVTYPNAYTVTYGYGTGGSSVSASATSVGGTFSSGAYVAANDVVTFSQIPAGGYTFKGWYTTAGGNTGAGVDGGNQLTINATKTVYAQYNPTTYTNVILDKTIGDVNGAYSVTFGGTAITVTTAPTRTGYLPEGYYESYANSVWTNKIATSAGSLQNGTTYTDATGHWTSTASPTLYTKWQPKTYTITLSMNGTYVKNGSATATYDDVLSGITKPERTGYHVDGYYKQAGLTNKIAEANGSLCASTDYTNSSSKWTNDGAVTLYTKWEANSYKVHFNGNGNTGGSMSDETGFTYDVSKALTDNAFTKTGYDFAGWATSAGGDVVYSDGQSVSNLTSVENGTAQLYAKWTAKNYTITLDKQSSASGHAGDGTVSNPTATYDEALPALSGTMPTAITGWAFMGFYSKTGGAGTKFINANGTWAVTNVTDTVSNGNWVFAGDLTLYAYYKKAEITDITLSAGTVEASATMTATAVVSPTPTGTHLLCWYLLYNDGSLHPSQPTFSETGVANQVSFTVPDASGSYKVQAVLRTGSSCGGGTELSSYAAGFQVAGIHNVRILYKCGDKTVKASTTLEGIKPLEWSSEITPGDAPFGYTFQKWVAGDGVTITTDGGSTTVTETTSSTIKIQAIYDGELVAQYTKDNIIYFKNTLNWGEVWVNLLTDTWWNASQGTGNETLADDKRNKQMQLVPGTTNIYYYNYGSTGTTNYVSFTDQSQDNYYAFTGTASNPVKVVYPTRPTPAGAAADTAAYGFNAGTPMFVPLAIQSAQPWNKVDGTDRANYYNKGYWRNYDPVLGEEGSTGYTLYVYNQTKKTDGGVDRKVLYTVPFNNSDVDGQLFKASVELEGSKSYGIKFIRDNDWGYTNTTGRLNRTGDVVIMGKEPEESYQAVYILTTAADKYDFIITCNGNGKLCLQATFPVAEGDYRVIYTDNATWTPENGAHTAHTWYHPSRAISAVANAVDTVSFWVKKGASPEYKIQKVKSIDEGSGAVTWQDVTEWTSCNDVASTGVYNFIFTQNESKAISLTKKEAYKGEFYIRTDNAGSTKWDNYRTDDHKMTYSEYAAGLRHKESTNDFTHYFMKFVDKDKDGGKYKNVKFTIANDYSPCISDTLKQQTGDTSADPAYEHVDSNGDLKANANIRFMWNQTDNSLKRAYLSPAKDDGTEFLVMQGQDTELLDKDGNALRNSANSGQSGYNHKAPDNAIQFIDKENWMYEAEVQAVPGAYIKLYAKYDKGYFYFYGTNDATFDDDHAMKLITGSGSTAQKIRVVYDFKSDRLIAAWLPTDEAIAETRPINADIMIVREHQDPGQQINLTGGSLTEIKNVYGVMRFNRWTLNNKSTVNTGTEENPVHAVLPVGDQKSQYERFNYFISFPFNVKVGEIFGFGQVGRHWRIFYYDGLGRAQEGFFAERGTDNWRMIADTDDELKANEGYLLQLNYVRMKDDNTSTWPHKQMNEVELYFPAKDNITAINGDDVTIDALGEEYHCQIDLRAAHGGNPEADRTVKDSYWRCIGVPGFTSYVANDTWTNFQWNLDADDVPYLYQWQMDDNKLNVVTANNFTFLPMHAYLIQNGNSFTWNNVSKPVISSIVARRAMTKEEEQYYEFKLDMRNGEQELDHTFIRLTNREDATTEFDFGQDLSKELGVSYNIYTHVGYERLAANNLPISQQTTVVPVGVTASEAGEFTFSMPEGTHGVSVILVDNTTGDRTNLALFDYKVSLEKGDYDQRFILEISPIQQTATDIEQSSIINDQSSIKKVMIDQILYIIKDGVMYDARGARVQ